MLAFIVALNRESRILPVADAALKLFSSGTSPVKGTSVLIRSQVHRESGFYCTAVPKTVDCQTVSVICELDHINDLDGNICSANLTHDIANILITF